MIIGCGWLGLPLAEYLLQRGYEVAGSVRSSEKMLELECTGIDLFLYDGVVHCDIPLQLRDADRVVVNFPPSKSTDYASQIRSLLSQFSSKTNIIFTSSTGVYAGTGRLDETGEVAEDHPVRLAEKEVERSGMNYTILRLAGLIGGERHPVKHLSGKAVDNGQQVVNLVHREDVIRAIELAIMVKSSDSIFNISYPEHTTRKAYYTAKANEFGIDPPMFTTSDVVGKEIDAKLFSQEYCFDYLTSI